MHPVWVRIHQWTMRELKKTTIASLAKAPKRPAKLPARARVARSKAHSHAKR
jgi:hypothetical protein